MNPTLLHNSYTPNYLYQPSDRHYGNGSFPNGDLAHRKDGLASGSMSQSMVLGTSNNAIQYGGTQLHHDAPCNPNSHLILTPPQSSDDSSSTATNPSSTSFSFSSLPKVTGSIVSGPDYYPTTSSSSVYASYGQGMTRPMHIPGPVPLSPPYSYGGHMSTSSFPPSYSMARTIEPCYSSSRLPHHHDIFHPPSRVNQPLTHYPSSFPGRHFGQNTMPQPPSRPEGPPFEDTNKLQSLVNSQGQNLTIEVLASIPKGFFRVDDKWTCYRRNYFSVSCGFTFKHNSGNPVYLQRYARPEAITQYAVSIAARTAAANTSESEARGLVQHTPKRDKATESVPTRHIIVPASSQNLSNNHSIGHSALYNPNTHLGGCLPGGFEMEHSVQQSPQTNYMFERIQFQKATANNGKRRAQQQYFHVVVKLEANVGRQGGPDEWVVVATRQSHPMVVRGRSPGHYKDNRRDSQTSMDPDGGSGNSADGHSNFPSNPFGNNSSTSLHGIHPYRQSQGYGSSYSSHINHHVEESEGSTASPEPSTTESSPAKGDNYHSSCSMTRTPRIDTSYDKMTLSPILNKLGQDVMDSSQSRKRPFEDDTSDCANSFFQTPLDSAYQTPMFDFSATSTAQTLYVTS